MNLLAAIVLSNFAEMCKQEAYPISPDQVYSHPLLPLQFSDLKKRFGTDFNSIDAGARIC